ncbi:hypothetical protein, partial [Streptomyces alkaliphilus]|uniref:hypothetical protein n=1 Tax=Streptomyces alkaliphilus TaxID=1472722 RepID=UPI00117F60AD
IDHLTRLGVTAVELLPVHQFAHEDHLLKRGLRNYWARPCAGPRSTLQLPRPRRSRVGGADPADR